MKPMNNNATGSKISVMFTQSYQWKRSFTYTNSIGYCDQSIIFNRSSLIPLNGKTLKYVTVPTSYCDGYIPISTDEYCTDFSALMDSSSEEASTIKNITAESKFCVTFQDGNWIIVLSTVSSTGRRKKDKVIVLIILSRSSIFISAKIEYASYTNGARVHSHYFVTFNDSLRESSLVTTFSLGVGRAWRQAESTGFDVDLSGTDDSGKVFGGALGLRDN
jgi:hypothetical protein